MGCLIWTRHRGAEDLVSSPKSPGEAQLLMSADLAETAVCKTLGRLTKIYRHGWGCNGTIS